MAIYKSGQASKLLNLENKKIIHSVNVNKFLDFDDVFSPIK